MAADIRAASGAEERGTADKLITWARHTTGVRVLREVLSALDAYGIRAMPVKGILTAHTLYDDVAERPIADIDLRVARADFPSLLQLARQRDWRPRVDSPHLWETVMTVDGWEVDVESCPSDPGLCALSIAEMIARARQAVEPFGFDHLQPEVNDHALLLALNAFKDGLRPLPWALSDLLRIVHHEEFEADLLVRRARDGRILSALWLVADWLAREHGAARWLEVQDRIDHRFLSKRVVSGYRLLLSRGWPPRVGMLVTGASNDHPLRSAWGLSLTIAGIFKGRRNRGGQPRR